MSCRVLLMQNSLWMSSSAGGVDFPTRLGTPTLGRQQGWRGYLSALIDEVREILEWYLFGRREYVRFLTKGAILLAMDTSDSSASPSSGIATGLTPAKTTMVDPSSVAAGAESGFKQTNSTLLQRHDRVSQPQA